MSIFIIFKIGLSGFTFSYYLSHHLKNKSPYIAAISIFYALSSYICAYSWNLMWLDCIWLFPLIMLGLERLIKEGKCVLYCITLGLCILSNYYISIMVCIFCVLYFIVEMIAFCTLFCTRRRVCRIFIDTRVFRSSVDSFWRYEFS